MSATERQESDQSTETFEPKIIALVCNWCTYLGADLAGTNRMEYPTNVRIVRLPCTGRIDFNLIIKAFETGADAVLVSGCHPGDCHYTSGNFHARRRWMLFRELLETMGIEQCFLRLYGPDLINRPKEGALFYHMIFEDSGEEAADSIVIDDKVMILEWAAETGATCIQISGEAPAPTRFPAIRSLGDLPEYLGHS